MAVSAPCSSPERRCSSRTVVSIAVASTKPRSACSADSVRVGERGGEFARDLARGLRVLFVDRAARRANPRASASAVSESGPFASDGRFPDLGVQPALDRRPAARRAGRGAARVPSRRLRALRWRTRSACARSVSSVSSPQPDDRRQPAQLGDAAAVQAAQQAAQVADDVMVEPQRHEHAGRRRPRTRPPASQRVQLARARGTGAGRACPGPTACPGRRSRRR